MKNTILLSSLVSTAWYELHVTVTEGKYAQNGMEARDPWKVNPLEGRGLGRENPWKVRALEGKTVVRLKEQWYNEKGGMIEYS